MLRERESRKVSKGRGGGGGRRKESKAEEEDVVESRVYYCLRKQTTCDLINVAVTGSVIIPFTINN